MDEDWWVNWVHNWSVDGMHNWGMYGMDGMHGWHGADNMDGWYVFGNWSRMHNAPVWLKCEKIKLKWNRFSLFFVAFHSHLVS